MQSAIRAYEAGQYDEATRLCEAVIRLNPQAADAHHLRGAIAATRGKWEEAVPSYLRAVQLRPGYYDAHCNLGHAFQLAGDGENAIAQLMFALSINREGFAAWNTLGAVMLEQHRYGDAQTCLEKALALRPDDWEVQLNLGNLQREQGDFDRAAGYFARALELRPDRAAPRIELGHMWFAAGEVDRALASFLEAIEIEPGSDAAYDGLVFVLLRCERFDELAEIVAALCNERPVSVGELSRLVAAKALAEFLQGRLDQCRKSLLEAWSIFQQREQKLDRLILEIFVFHRYLTRLLDLPELKGTPLDSPADAVHFIGDSHCLSAARQTVQLDGRICRVMPHLVMGCKAWHLARSEPSKYKQTLLQVLEGVPAGSHAIFCFGEIDCRLNEGILRRLNKHPELDLESLVLSTALPYVERVISLAAQRQLIVYFQGVPAPNVDFSQANAAEKERLLTVIRLFNAAVATLARDKKAGFLDVYALTAGPDGASNREWHMDPHHLRPGYLRNFFDGAVS